MQFEFNIGLLIKRLRRFLLLALVVVCAGMGIKKIYEKEEQYTPVLSAKWGSDAEKLAREMDMPIFFSIKDTFRKEALSEDIIKKHFIYTELDPELYPGDYIALKALHCNIGEDVQITCGVLTSKMYPILTSTNTIFETKDEYPSIKSTLVGLINIYHENYNRFLRISKNFSLLNDIPSKYQIEELKEDMSKLVFMLDFGYQDKFKSAQLSESARLIFRNCTVKSYTPFKTKLKNTAYNEIIKKAKEANKLNFVNRAFYARALADYILIFNDAENVHLLKDFADEILLKQANDGSFLIDDTKDSIKNAISLTIISYAYKVTKDELYKKAIDKFTQFLEKELKQSHGLVANFEKGGVACAKGYVYLSRALLNAYIVTLDKDKLDLTNQVLMRLNKKHKELNAMILELSEESSLAKYINLCSVEDSEFTSTNGVLLQVYSDLKTLNLSNVASKKIVNILDATLDSPCEDIDFDFSLRIAKYPNPLIRMSTLRKLAKNKEKLTSTINKF